MNKPILQIKNMRGDILKGINLNLYPGEIHVLVGLGESGKEEFVFGLTGKKQTSGEIFTENKQLQFDLDNLKRNKIEFLFEEPELVEELTVAENISLNDFSAKKFSFFIDWKRVRNNYKEVIDLLNVEIGPDVKVSNLSKEERKTLVIAKTFLNNPEVIIMYEPTNGLGAKFIQKLYSLINDFTEKGGSIIYVSKQWEETLKIADKISILSNGEIVKTINSKEANKDPKKLINMMFGNRAAADNKLDLEERGNKFLNGVFKATKFLTSEYELNDVLNLLAEYIADIMKADGCTIKLIDESTKTIIDTVNFKTEENIQADLKEDMIFQISQKDDIYYASEQEKDFSFLFENLNKVESMICLPVLIRSHVTGFIQIYYKEHYIYSEKEAMYLSTLARQAAIAIEDTRLMGKSALLQESHHRIKNNLQYIISLVKLQKDFIDQEEKNIEHILDNIISRVKSIASVHDLISNEELGRSIINVKEIINTLLEFLKNSKVELVIDLEDIFISYEKASAIALVVNELISNSLEHAFTEKEGREKDKIEIQCWRKDDIIYLNIQDNGIGLPDDFQVGNFDTLGLSIVHSIIIKQFRGSINFINNSGTQVKVEIPLKN